MTNRQTLDAALRHRDRMLREPDAWMWWTFWQVVLVSEGMSIGLVDFKGPPGPEGGVAVGASFAPTLWDRGYATEAVGALVAWALGQASVRFITADTHVTNVRSHRVLQKLGFVSTEPVARGTARHGDAGDLLVWRLVKQGRET
jgi:RimJ/RimL family protein N-acetyltransferase